MSTAGTRRPWVQAPRRETAPQPFLLHRAWLKLSHRAAAMAVASLALVLYAFTLAPTVVAGDAGELVTAAYELGVAHPPGYPLWTLLTHVAIFVFGDESDVAYRANLFSAVCSAGACLLVFLTARKLGAGRAAAFGGAILLAASREFWAQSVIAEVYALNALIFMGCLWALANWDQCRRRRWLWLFAGLLGLGMANHHTIGILGPAGLVFVLIRQWRVILDWRLVGGSLAAFILPLSLYLYLPWAASTDPYMNWGHPQSLAALIDHITRAQYKASREPLPRTLLILFFQVSTVLRYYLSQFSPLVGAALLIAIPWAIHYRFRPGWRPLAILAVAIALTFGWVLNIKPTRQAMVASQVFFIPLYCCIAILAAGALDVLLRRLRRQLRELGPPMLRAGVTMTLVLAPAACAFGYNLETNDFSDYWYAEDHARNLLATVEQDGVIFPSGDHNTFPLIYLKGVERARPDVTIADKYGYIEARSFPDLEPKSGKYELNRRRVKRYLLSETDRSFYTTVKQPAPRVKGAKQMRTGLLYRVSGRPPDDKPASYWNRYRYRNAGAGFRSPPDYGAVNIVGDFFFFRGLEELRQDKPNQALAAFGRAARVCRGIKQVHNNIGSALAEHGLIEPATRYYDRALSLDGDYASALWNRARTAKNRKNYKTAANYFTRLREAKPDDFRVPGELGFLHLRHLDNPQKAAEYLQASLDMKSNQPEIKRALARLERTGAVEGAAPDPDPVLAVKPETHDFGQVIVGTPHRTKMTVTNVSDRKVAINKVTSDCGCTSPSMQQRKLKPGATATLEVKFHEKRETGPQKRKVTLRPKKGPSLTVPIRADVVSPYKSDPPKVTVESVLLGKKVDRTITVTSRRGERFRVSDVQAKINDVTLESGKKANELAGQHSLAMEINAGRKPKQRRGSITLTLADLDGDKQSLSVPVQVTTKKPVTLDPSSIFLSSLKQTGAKTVAVTIKLAKDWTVPVEKINSSAKWITVPDPPDTLTRSTTLKIQLDTKAMPDSFDGTLTLRTEHDTVGTIVVPIYGYLD